MSNSTIRSVLETRLKVWADAQTPIVKIAFEGASFTKPTSGVFLEPLLLPNITLNNEISGTRKTHLGIFEVKCWGRSGKGMGAVEQLTNSIINLFPLVPKVAAVSVERTPYAEHASLDDSGWIVVPVLIEYRYEGI